MRKILAVILAALMLLSAAACSTAVTAPENEDPASSSEVVENQPVEEEVVEVETFKNTLVETDWVLYSIETIGVVIDYVTLNATGYSGSMEFKEDDTFDLVIDMGGATNIDGTYECSEEDKTVTLTADGDIDVKVEDDVLTLSVSESGVTLTCEFVAADSDKIKEAEAELEIPEYDGELAGTSWALHSVVADGVTISSSMLGQFGFSGKISFTEDAFVMELIGQTVEGGYELNGDEIVLDAGNSEQLVLSRDGGLLTLDVDGQGTFNFAYSE